MPTLSLRLRAELMEDRILHSADIAPLLMAGSAAADSLAHESLQTASADATVQRSEIVFVDAALPDAASLLADLQAQQRAGRSIEIFTIEAGQDGIALIGATLAARHDVSAVHVLAHGSDGVLRLGSAQLDAQTMLQRAGEVAAWGQALTADADLLLYGCDVAQTAAGQHFVADLAALTGADVAASADLTGATARGGNWTLEYRIGQIQATLAPSRWEQTQWQGVMATYTVTTTADVTGDTLLAGSLRWAISQANANAGNDTIDFAVNGTFGIVPSSSGGDDNKTGDFDITDSVNIVGNGTGNTIISGNGADRVFDLRSGTISLSGVTVEGGKSSTGAGIRINNSANVTLTDAVIQNNAGNGSSKGGGIYNDGVLTLQNSIVQNNGSAFSSSIDGAGIYNAGGATLSARDVEIRNNIAAGGKDGGGLYVDGGVVALQNVTFFGNQATRGGGLWNHSDSTSLLNVTFSGNFAWSEGGGLRADRDITLDHVTVANNSVSALGGIGGGVYDNGGHVTAKNSLFANNSGGNTNLALISQGYNLSDDNSPGFLGTGDQKNVAAGLLALADNGGFTRTHAITAGSAARDAANPVPAVGTDQRGIAYSGGRADIGAYEYNLGGFAPTVSAVANQTIDENAALGPITVTVGDFESGAGSLIVTATSSNTALVPNANIVLGGSGASRTISLTPTTNANSSDNGGPTTITLSVSDGGNVTTTTFSVTVQTVNNPPTLTLPVAQAVDEGGELTLSGANAPGIGDVDAGTASLQVTVAATNGTLKLSQTTGLLFVTGNAGFNATMTFNGSLADINAALDGLRYKPAGFYTGAAQIDLSVNDLGNSGSGGAKTASGSIAINVNAVNDAPLLGLPGAQATPQPTPLTFGAASGNAITLFDIDAGSANVQLSLSTSALANGTLTFGSTAGLTLVSGTGSSDTTVVLRGTLADLNAALATLSFSATGSGAARIDITLDDLGNTGAGGAKQASGAVTITVANDALPVLTLAQTTLTYTENGAATPLDAGLTVSDSDHPTLASALVRISSGYAGAEDVLAFTNVPATMGNIAGSYSAGVLSLSSAGQTATLAQWQAALQSITYVNTSDAPGTAPRTVTLTVNDGIADSAAREITISVTAVNDAPLLAGANNLASIAEDAASNAGTLVSTLIAGQISDADAAAQVGIAVTAANDANGIWQYTTDDGISWSAFNDGFDAASDTSARLLTVDANNAVRFVPNSNWNGTLAGALTFRAWDQTLGSAGGTADTSSNGGSSAFSGATASSSITVTPVNDAPVLAGPIAAQTATQGVGFAVTLPPGSFTDADTGDVLTYTATLASGAALPAWLSFDAGTQTFSGTPANADVGSISVRVTARDGSDGVFGDFTLDVANVNDTPLLDTPIADQAATQDVAFVFGLPADSFTDADAGDVLTYTATLASGAALPTWLSFDAATHTFNGTPANGDVGAISVRVTATDTSNASVFDDFTLNVANANDTPTGLPVIAGSAAEDQTLTADTSAIADADGLGTFNYQWLRNGNAVSGATASNYLLGDADVGAQFSVRVRYTDGHGTVETLTSSATAAVANVNDAPTGQPTITGSATEDQTLTANTAAIADADGLGTFNYQWLRNGSTVSGATASTYTLGDADVGAQIAVRVSYTDGQGTVESLGSAATAVVANINDAPSGNVAIAGNATQGQTLGVANTLTDADGLGPISYQWWADGAAIAGATGSTLLLGQVEVNKAISVTASYTDGQGTVETLTSAATAAVANVNDAPMLAAPIGDRAVEAGSPMQFQLPSATFADPDAGDTLHYAAALADGSALPDWLTFDERTLAFTAAPDANQTGAFMVRVTARDDSGAAAQALFAVIVSTPTAVTPPSTIDAGVVLQALPAEPQVAVAAPARGAPAVPPAPAPAAPPAPTAQPAALTFDAVADAPRRGLASTTDSTGSRPASRSDSVLAVAVAPEYKAIDLGSLVQLLKSDEMMRKLEEIQRRMLEQGGEHHTVVASALAASSGLSIGYVIWLVRGGVLVSSMLSALPAWQMIDPMPVVAAAGVVRARRSKSGNDDGDVERLFDSGHKAADAPTPEPAAASKADAKPGAKEETP